MFSGLGNIAELKGTLSDLKTGLLRVVAPRYCNGAAGTVVVAPLLLVEKNGDGSTTTFSPVFLALHATATFEHRQLYCRYQ